MKIRTQLQLDREDHQALKKWPALRGISVSAAVRWEIRERVIGERGAPEEAVARAIRAAGAIRGRWDDGKVSLEHDRACIAVDPDLAGWGFDIVPET